MSEYIQLIVSEHIQLIVSEYIQLIVSEHIVLTTVSSKATDLCQRIVWSLTAVSGRRFYLAACDSED